MLSYFMHDKHLLTHVPWIPQEIFKTIIYMSEMMVSILVYEKVP
jgi:hypothetical protein